MTELHPKLTELAEGHPCRFTADEKSAFLLAVRRLLRSAGYTDEELNEQRTRGLLASRNLIIGDEKAPVLITAHYDTPGRNGFLLSSAALVGQTWANVLLMLLLVPFAVGEGVMLRRASPLFSSSPFLALLLALAVPAAYLALMLIPMLIKNPHNRNDNTSGTLCVLECALLAAKDPELRKRCCFVLFDNEEWGLNGSSQYAADRRRRGLNKPEPLLINLDSVGVGDRLIAARTGKSTPDGRAFLERLRRSGEVEEKRSAFVYMSDHASFGNSLMLSYMKRSKLGPLYIPHIHTTRDKECSDELVARLAERLAAAVSAEHK